MYQLYDRGLVKSLDDLLSDYCPRFSMLNPFNSRNITLRQIASQVTRCTVHVHLWYEVWIDFRVIDLVVIINTTMSSKIKREIEHMAKNSVKLVDS